MNKFDGEQWCWAMDAKKLSLGFCPVEVDIRAYRLYTCEKEQSAKASIYKKVQKQFCIEVRICPFPSFLNLNNLLDLHLVVSSIPHSLSYWHECSQ